MSSCPIDPSIAFDLGPIAADTTNGIFWDIGHEPILPQSSTSSLKISNLEIPSCTCTVEAAETIRGLRKLTPSHSMASALRLATELAERVLDCTVCYDWTQPPRVTIQNVMLVGRLMTEVASGYSSYVRWVRKFYNGLDDDDSRQTETVYLLPDGEVDSVLGFRVSGRMALELIMRGLQVDAEQLAGLGEKFAARQKARHQSGHEACPDAEGRCWREVLDVDMDPSDICPHNCVLSTLTPCFRIVEAVQSSIKVFSDAVGIADVAV